MADLFLLSRVQMRRIERYFPLSHGIARVDDRPSRSNRAGRVRAIVRNRLGLAAIVTERCGQARERNKSDEKETGNEGTHRCHRL